MPSFSKNDVVLVRYPSSDLTSSVWPNQRDESVNNWIDLSKGIEPCIDEFSQLLGPF